MSDGQPNGARLDACDDCTLSDASACCGAAHGATLLRSDRAVLAAAGPVILVIVLAVLTVPTSRHAIVLAAALPTLLLAAAVGVLGTLALCRVGGAADRAGAAALRMLPVAAAGLLLTLASGLVLAAIR